MGDKYEVILAGSGGQGLVSAGIILAEAAMLEGNNVVQTQSYGIASRGGFSQAEVIISKEEILFQQVQHPDVILALTEEAMRMYATSGVPVYYDSALIAERSGDKLYGIPFVRIATSLGQVGTANIIALGLIAARERIVKVESLESVIKKRFSGPTAQVNLKALHYGAGLAVSSKGETRIGEQL